MTTPPAGPIEHARALLARGDHGQAEMIARGWLEQHPADAAASMIAARAANLTGRHDEARALLETAAAAHPDDVDLWIDLARTHVSEGAYDAAVTAFETAGRLDTGDERVPIGLAEVDERRGDLAAALARLDALADGSAPAPLRADTVRIRLLQRSKDLAAARALADRTLEREDCTGGVRRSVLFLAGRMADDAGETETAVRHLTEGNRIGAIPFDRQRTSLHLMSIRTVFGAGRMADMPHATIDTRGPILITGLPRSGSTLLERMLAAHPRVAGAGESSAMTDVHRAVLREDRVQLPAGWPTLPPARLDALARLYMEALRRHAAPATDDPAVDRVVDKHLGNVLHLGAISRMLPDATLVIVHRRPLDAALSCWMQDLIPTLHPWTTRLGDAGWYVRQIGTHADHWREVLGDRLVDVAYETLVAEPEPTLRRVLEAAGLPWDDACLRPERARADVATASYAQVAEPVHRKAVGRADRYRPHLGPMLRTLGEA